MKVEDANLITINSENNFNCDVGYSGYEMAWQCH